MDCQVASKTKKNKSEETKVMYVSADYILVIEKYSA